MLLLVGELQPARVILVMLFTGNAIGSIATSWLQGYPVRSPSLGY